MNRGRALEYSIGVSVLVFVVLALPVLRELYGPVAALGAYAGVALVAGGMTWSLLRSRGESATDTAGPTVRIVGPGTEEETEAVPVEGELKMLREQVGSDGDGE